MILGQLRTGARSTTYAALPESKGLEMLRIKQRKLEPAPGWRAMCWGLSQSVENHIKGKPLLSKRINLSKDFLPNCQLIFNQEHFFFK